MAGESSIVSGLAGMYERWLIETQRWSIMSVPRSFGSPIIYCIHYNDDPELPETLKYIGSSKDGNRPWQHRTKLKQAGKIDESRAFLRAVRCPDAVMAKLIEDRLIAYYNPEWNKSGFGHRPGIDRRERRRNPWATKYDFWYGGGIEP